MRGLLERENARRVNQELFTTLYHHVNLPGGESTTHPMG